ncbi:hypothetical protein Celaphus_00009474 [Cervus elaphus hippelaphus]|uniref:Uncharacterized protein n=1 Tax=Cervus elaphus hippelaphus TaxID=46360 RepID=A0A212BZA6_CEREH|nr:hypothetical protein Celaphus_00009474 [Cervus elaphus hippelaphus]
MCRGSVCSTAPPASLFQLRMLFVPPRYLHPAWLGEHQSAGLSPLVCSHLAFPPTTKPLTGTTASPQRVPEGDSSVSPALSSFDSLKSDCTQTLLRTWNEFICTQPFPDNTTAEENSINVPSLFPLGCQAAGSPAPAMFFHFKPHLFFLFLPHSPIGIDHDLFYF